MTLIDFIRESNHIENIHREPTPGEIKAHGVLHMAYYQALDWARA